MKRRTAEIIVTVILLAAFILVVSAVSVFAQAPGTVEAWGHNERGQLGNGTIADRFTFVPPVHLSETSNVTAIAAGGGHSLALSTDGTVMAWGDNTSGQLGDGTTTMRTTPVPVSGLANIIAIAASGGDSFALLSDGTLMAWGANDTGQLGDGTFTARAIPAPVSGLGNVLAIATAGADTFALLSDGTVMGWGYNGFGEVGDGTDRNFVLRPSPVVGLVNVTAIASQGDHALALLADGTVMAWGTNEYGELGDGTTKRRTTPVLVSGLANVVAIACGGELGTGNASSSLALLADGTVMAWGQNRFGQLGDGTATEMRITPGPVSGIANVTAIAAGDRYSLALLSDGTVMAWGYQRGLTPTQVSGIANVTAIAGGSDHNLALF